MKLGDLRDRLAELVPDGDREAVVAWTDDRGDLRTSPVTGALGLASADGLAQIRLRLPSGGPAPETHLPLAELREQIDALGGGPTDQVVVARSGLGGVRLLPVVGIGRDGGMRTSSGKPLMLPPPLPQSVPVPPIPEAALVGAGSGIERASRSVRAVGGPVGRRPRVAAALGTALAVGAVAVALNVTHDDRTVVGTKVESASVERPSEATDDAGDAADDAVVPSVLPPDAEAVDPSGAEAARSAGEGAGSQQPAPTSKSKPSRRPRATTTTEAERKRSGSRKPAATPVANPWITLFVVPRQPPATTPRSEQPVVVANVPVITPTTARPATNPPTTSPPATTPPTTAPPTTPPPTTSPPPTEPPPTEPPPTSPPSTAPPVVL